MHTPVRGGVCASSDITGVAVGVPAVVAVQKKRRRADAGDSVRGVNCSGSESFAQREAAVSSTDGGRRLCAVGGSAAKVSQDHIRRTNHVSDIIYILRIKSSSMIP